MIEKILYAKEASLDAKFGEYSTKYLEKFKDEEQKRKKEFDNLQKKLEY